MRYHTTFKDIAVSILVVLACTGICLYGMLFFSVINPAQPFADSLVASLDRGSELSFRTTGIARSFFKEVEARELSVSLDDTILVSSDSLVLDTGLTQLLFSLMGKADKLTFTLDRPSVDITMDQVEALAGGPSQGGPSFLTKWVGKNSLELKTNALHASFTAPSYSASIQNSVLALSLEPGLALASFKGSIESGEAHVGGQSVRLDRILMDIDSTLVVNAESEAGSLNLAGTAVAFEQLVMATLLPSLDIAKGGLAIDFSLADLRMDGPVLTATMPKLSSRLSLEDLSFIALEASYDRLDLKVADLTLYSPTSTISLKQEGPSLLLSFATKAGSPLTVEKVGYSPLLSNTLIGSAQLEDDGQLYARLSISEMKTRLGDAFIGLGGVQLSSAALLGKDGIQDISLFMDSEASVAFEKADIQLSSPLSASLLLSDAFGSLSASLELPTLSSSLTDEPFAAALAYQQNREGGQAQGRLSFANQLLISALYDLPKGEKGTFSLKGRMQDFPIALSRPALVRYAPFITPYYSDTTRLTGNLSFQSTEGTGTILGFDGTLASDLVLLDLSLGNRSLDAGFTILAGIEGDSVVVDSLSLSTADLRLAYSGATNLNNWLPSGELRLFDTEEGTLLISANFSPLPPNTYRYALSTPLVPSLGIEGIIAQEQGLKKLTSDAKLSVYGTEYPLTFTFLTPTLLVELDSGDNLKLQADLAPPYRANLVVQDLRMPAASVIGNSFLDGEFLMQFNTLSDWRLEAREFKLASLLFNGERYDLGGSLFAFPSSLKTASLTLSQGPDRFDISLEYRGGELLKTFQAGGLTPFSFTFTLGQEEQHGIAVALTGSTSRVEALVELNQVGLGRFYSPLAGVDLNLTAFGHTDFKKRVSMDGKLSLESPLFSFVSDLSATDTQLQIENGLFKQGTLLFKDMELALDADKGLLTTQGRFEHIRTIPYTEQTSHFTLNLSVPFAPTASLFDLGKVIRALPAEGVSGIITIDDLLLLGEGGIADGWYSLTYKQGAISLTSPLLSFSYDSSDGALKATVDKDFGIGLGLDGWIRPEALYLKAGDIHFPLTLLNRLFVKPIFGFIDGIAHGELIIGGTLEKPNAYGQLSLDAASMDLFWLPQDILSVRSATVTLDGQRATSPTFPFFSTNRETGVTIRGVANLSANFDGLSLTSYEINARPTEGQVFVYIPIPGIDAEVLTYAEGTFSLFGVGYQTWLSGDVLLENTTMSLGLQGLPPWYEATGLTSTDFRITTGKNVSFFYPNMINPFIKATLTENQKIDILFDHTTEEISLDGSFAFRSGEIYYFQKNFFITEGSLTLHTDALSGSSTVQPRINLRAKLTDFDRGGNRVDIFMVLRDSSLTNLNPQFESIPSKDVNEILEIMGQSILPSGAYGQVNLFSVVSLAAAATDVAGKLGYINTGNNTALTESIRISLGLDLFSLRSNVVQNILFDALPGSNLSTGFSPLARYLNNTTIFMGKYIGKNYFLQALIHLSATDRSKIKRSFVAPDLAIDLELSMEWNNPLGTFSFFTQPNELSLYNIFDTIGFSVTKRIVLR
ncbi:MAG: hypothetical protein RBR15_15480 [Sphaerochaeta sp.]|nr:hypothetical protein [Sphaerochaeta sp.]